MKKTRGVTLRPSLAHYHISKERRPSPNSPLPATHTYLYTHDYLHSIPTHACMTCI